jgi:hypothetical protein
MITDYKGFGYRQEFHKDRNVPFGLKQDFNWNEDWI